MNEKILILDFGSQVTQLIARRVRESGVYCEILPFNADPARIAGFGASGIILSGGPASVADAGSPRAPDYVFTASVPVLGKWNGNIPMGQNVGAYFRVPENPKFARA
jgi:GMP synthase (glutamine-hydrolysing)